MQIDFAFDKLTDKDFKSLQKMFSFKGLKKLIFDEAPYKYYMVRPAQPPILSYICFDEPYSESEDEHALWSETNIGVNLRRIYKGEGSVSFIAYYPYARAIKPTMIVHNVTGTRVLNLGDLSADLEFIYNFNTISSGLTLTITNEDENQLFSIGAVTPVSGDIYLLINSRTQLLEGLDSNRQKTGNLYNRFITQGDFPILRPGFSTVASNYQFISAEFVPVYY